MKKFAVSTLGLALWMQGVAQAQSPFFQPAQAPVQPVVAQMPAVNQFPPGGVVPVRVHFGGALTTDGVAPLSVFMNQNNAPAVPPGPRGGVPAAATSANVRQTSAGTDNGAAKQTKPTDVFVNDDACAPTVCDPRFTPPCPDDLHRPDRIPCGYRWYASSEFLYWWVKRQDSPTLLLVDGAPKSAYSIDNQTHPGGRITLGHWFEGPCHPWALEASFMSTSTRRSRATVASTGLNTIEHPFIDADTGLPDTLPVATNDGLAPRSGTAFMDAQSRMWGFEANLRREICRTSHGHLDLLLGYRQFQLEESLILQDQVFYNVNPLFLGGATVTAFDDFGTRNRLMAGQIGVEGEFNWRRLFIDAWGKFALGSNQELINIKGATFIRETPGVPPPPFLGDFAGNLYSQRSNIGRYRDDHFTVMPEVGVTAGYALTSNCRLSAGYNLLYLNNVVRPGDAIDTTISKNQIPQLQPFPVPVGSRPAPPSFVETNYWAHGLTVQMEIRY